MIIDAHLHLWEKQNGMVDGRPVVPLFGGRADFGGEIRQMLPPDMEDGFNSAERLISNMDYAGISAAVVTQEYIDGNQDSYLLKAKAAYPNRLKICSLYEENENYKVKGFDGVKVCAGRLKKKCLKDLLPLCQQLEALGLFLSIDLAEGAEQVPEMEQFIKSCPDLKVAIGHFGMVNRKLWEEQIKLARYPNVYIESGGITWLFHKEFYPYTKAVAAILRAKDICGIKKLMWGSDYPRTMTAITYTMSYDFLFKTQELTSEDRERFLFQNAFKFYQFDELTKIDRIKNMVED